MAARQSLAAWAFGLTVRRSVAVHTLTYLPGQPQVHTSPRGAGSAARGAGPAARVPQQAFVWGRPDSRAPLGSGLGGRRRIVTYDVGFATQVPRTLRARVSEHTPGW